MVAKKKPVAKAAKKSTAPIKTAPTKPAPAKKAPAKKAPAKKSPAKKVVKVVKPAPPSALAERKKAKGRALKPTAVWSHPDEEKKPAKKKAAKPAKKTIAKAAAKGTDSAAVKVALKKVVEILSQSIKML